MNGHPNTSIPSFLSILRSYTSWGHVLEQTCIKWLMRREDSNRTINYPAKVSLIEVLSWGLKHPLCGPTPGAVSEWELWWKDHLIFKIGAYSWSICAVNWIIWSQLIIHLLNTSISGIVLSSKGIATNETDKIPAFMTLTFNGVLRNQEIIILIRIIMKLLCNSNCFKGRFLLINPQELLLLGTYSLLIRLRKRVRLSSFST